MVNTSLLNITCAPVKINGDPHKTLVCAPAGHAHLEVLAPSLLLCAEPQRALISAATHGMSPARPALSASQIIVVLCVVLGVFGLAIVGWMFYYRSRSGQLQLVQYLAGVRKRLRGQPKSGPVTYVVTGR